MNHNTQYEHVIIKTTQAADGYGEEGELPIIFT